MGLVLRHINYIEIMILAVHRYSGRPILVRQLETLDIRLLQLKNYEMLKNTQKVTLFEQLKLIVYSELEMNDS